MQDCWYWKEFISVEQIVPILLTIFLVFRSMVRESYFFKIYFLLFFCLYYIWYKWSFLSFRLRDSFLTFWNPTSQQGFFFFLNIITQTKHTGHMSQWNECVCLPFKSFKSLILHFVHIQETGPLTKTSPEVAAFTVRMESQFGKKLQEPYFQFFHPVNTWDELFLLSVSRLKTHLLGSVFTLSSVVSDTHQLDFLFPPQTLYLLLTVSRFLSVLAVAMVI